MKQPQLIMTILDSTSTRRLFLPPLVRLQSDDSDEQVTLLSTDGFHSDCRVRRAHEHLVRELYNPWDERKMVPQLYREATGGEIRVVHATGELGKRLCDFGFERPARGLHTIRLEESQVADTIVWAARVGIALSYNAWNVLEDAGRTESASPLAWNGADAAFGEEREGAWASRLRDSASVAALRGELRAAIRASVGNAVHLVPTPSGELLQRQDRSDTDLGAAMGCGALAVSWDGARLRIYVPTRNWISWGLQRALLGAWAEEAFGEGMGWHWG